MIQERGLVVEWRPDHPIDYLKYSRAHALPRNAPADGLAHDALDPVDVLEVDDLFADAGAHGLLIDADPTDIPFDEDQGANNVGVDNSWTFHHEPQPAIVEYDDDDNANVFDDDKDGNDDDTGNDSNCAGNQGAQNEDEDQGARNDVNDEAALDIFDDDGDNEQRSVPPLRARTSIGTFLGHNGQLT